MADLTTIQASQSVTLVGANSSGVEQTPVESTPNGDLNTADLLVGSGVEGALTVGTSAVEAKVGGSVLVNRKLLTVHNNSSSIIYWGFTSAVTTSTGTPIFKDQFISWDISDAGKVYLIASGAGNNTRVTESV
jgi:hypothetical protein